MKKLFILAIFTLIIATSIFAKENNIALNTSVPESELTYNLYRKIGTEYTLIEDASTYVIDDLNSLKTNTMITDFTIRVDSNSNSAKSVSVEVTPGTFKTYLNDGTELYDSEITPKVNTIIDKGIVKAGLNSFQEVYRFNIFVVGKASLPAGDYTCNVDVEYTIQ
jgi:hypothetical protein